MAEPCRLRVIAVGSPFGADRIAWDALELLRAELPPGVEAHCCVHPVSELPQWLSGAEAVMLVDAMAGVAIGEVVRCGRAELAERGQGLSSHGLSVDLALDLAAALGELPAALAVVGLGVGGGHDDRLARALPGYAARLRAAILEEFGGAASRHPRGVPPGMEVRT